ncbi:MAG: alkaline phosphatase [Clostridia bacterium]|nr:alkaline phosphatase [Clostridia bacterium]
MDKFPVKKFLKSFTALMLLLSVLLTCSCGEKNKGDTVSPSLSPSPSPEVSMQAILDSLGDIEFTDAKNVILFIGDGMGENHIAATKAILGGQYSDKLAIEYLPNQGTAVTICADGEPDSASGGTALATGYKSKRKYLGMDKKKNVVQNVCELANLMDKKAGVVTNESIVDATPAAFTIHAPNRDDESNIAKLQIENCPDLIMGGGRAMYEKAIADDPTYEQKLTDNGITWAKTWDEVQDFTGGKLIATLTDDLFERVEEATPTLAQMTEKALELLSDDEDGFFLMVEGGAMDESAHVSDVMETCRQMISFDEAVSIGIKYAVEHPDTVVIVTADHNTGGLMETESANQIVSSAPETDVHVNALLEYEKELQAANPDIILSDLPYRFTTIAHTNDSVQIFAIGKGTEIFNGTTVKSCEIGQFIGQALSGEKFGDIK